MLSAALFVLLPVLVAVELHRNWLDWRAGQAVETSTQLLKERTDEVLRLALRELERLVETTGGSCTPDGIRLMLDTAYRAVVVREAGIFQQNRLLCTSWGKLPEPVAIHPSTALLTEGGVVLVPSVSSALGLSGISAALNRAADFEAGIGVNVLIPQAVFTTWLALGHGEAQPHAVLWTESGVLAATDPRGTVPALPNREVLDRLYPTDRYLRGTAEASLGVHILVAMNRVSIREDWLRLAVPALLVGSIAALGAALAVRVGASWRFDPLAELPVALADGELHFRFEPIVRLDDDVTAGFEMLARWAHPTLGELKPARFLVALEDRRLAGEVVRHTVSAAIRRAATLPPAFGSCYFSVNLPAVALSTPDWIPDVLLRLAKAGMRPSRLQLELTERQKLLPDQPANRAALAQLRAAGVRIALDDFGTGQNGLATLAVQTFDQVKIDRAFLTTMHIDPRARVVMETMVGLASRLSTQVVAEGIESRADVARLRDLGVTHGQGYLWLPADAGTDAEALIQA